MAWAAWRDARDASFVLCGKATHLVGKPVSPSIEGSSYQS